MFSLAIYDVLTPGSLTDGDVVAGTGDHRRRTATSGRSAASSRRSRRRATTAPRCSWCRRTTARTRSTRPDGDMRLVRADTMPDAAGAIEAWADDHDADLPQLPLRPRELRCLTTSTSTPPSPPPSSRSRATSPGPAGTSRPASTPWSRPPGIVAHEPALARAMGLDEAAAAGSLTPVEQDQLRPDQPLEQKWMGGQSGAPELQ